MSKNYSDYTVIAIHAALKAGEILRRGFGTLFEIRSKPGKQNFVTEYDKAAEDCIIEIIKQKYPSHSILAEESGFDQQQEEEVLWIIDPLDGTTNFAHQIPIVTVSIGVKLKHSLLCGVIYQPFTNELFVAEKEKGAFLNGAPLAVSQTHLIDHALIVAGLPYDIPSSPSLDVEDLLAISRRGATLRNLGSAALSLAYVAAGKVDALWMYNLYPWDFAAGQLLIEEAGGTVTRYPIDNAPQSPSNLLATNQLLHSQLTDLISV